VQLLDVINMQPQPQLYCKLRMKEWPFWLTTGIGLLNQH